MFNAIYRRSFLLFYSVRMPSSNCRITLLLPFVKCTPSFTCYVSPAPPPQDFCIKPDVFYERLYGSLMSVYSEISSVVGHFGQRGRAGSSEVVPKVKQTLAKPFYLFLAPDVRLPKWSNHLTIINPLSKNGNQIKLIILHWIEKNGGPRIFFGGQVWNKYDLVSLGFIPNLLTKGYQIWNKLAGISELFSTLIDFLFYFYVNGSIGIVQKIDFEIRPDLGCTTLKTSRKVVLDNPPVCLSVLLSLFPRALTGVRFHRSSWNFRGMFGYMGHCAVPIFEAIREPVYKII